jgi:hypothetical protein
MKTTELRINNILLGGIVTSINKNSFRVFDGYSHFDSEAMIEDWLGGQPIPITGDWLLKLGFDKFGSFYSVFYGSNYHSFTIKSKDGDLRFDIDEHGIITTSIKYNHIRYVHQLQNLYFALKGEELIVTP